MSNERDDGGLAFPTPYIHDPIWGPLYYSQYMSLRDWFAGQALNGLLSAPSHRAISMITALAYEYADAMLKARSSQQGQ